MILIGVGGNLPGLDGAPPLATCRAAVAGLEPLTGLRLRGVSGWYQTAPVPPSGQPPYVNAVAALEGAIDPAALLAVLQAMERRAGRVRGPANAARPLDLDVIAMGATVRDAPDPVLPHPRAHLRAFVLAPIHDLDPGWVHPRLGRSVADLLAAIDPPQALRRLDPP